MIQKQIKEKRAKSKAVENSIQDIIAKYNHATKSGALLGALLGALKSKSPLELEKQIPMRYIVFQPPIALSAVLLNSLHLALLKSYILNSGATKYIYNN